MREKTRLAASPDGETFVLTVERVDDGHHVSSDVSELDAHVSTDAVGRMSVLTKNGSYEASVERDGDELLVRVDQEWFRFGDELEGGASAPRARARAEVKSPMPGKVVEILAAVGDHVEAGQSVLLFEAMKMQNEIRSPQAGSLVSVDVSVGQTIDARERLFVIKGSSD